MLGRGLFLLLVRGLCRLCPGGCRGFFLLTCCSQTAGGALELKELMQNSLLNLVGVYAGIFVYRGCFSL